MLKLKKGNKWNDWQQLGRKPLWMLSRSTKSLLTFTKVKRYKILSRVQAHIVSICFQSQDSLEVTQESADFASRQQCIFLLRWLPAYWLLSILCLPLQLLDSLQHTLMYKYTIIKYCLYFGYHYHYYTIFKTHWLMYKYKVLSVFQDMHEAAFFNPIKWSTWLYRKLGKRFFAKRTISSFSFLSSLSTSLSTNKRQLNPTPRQNTAQVKKARSVNLFV